MHKDLDQAKGRLKKAAGDLTGNDELRREGKKDELAGKAKEGVERAADAIDDAVDRLRGRPSDR